VRWKVRNQREIDLGKEENQREIDFVCKIQPCVVLVLVREEKRKKRFGFDVCKWQVWMPSPWATWRAFQGYV
jgi:hypothetical protein